MIRIINQSYEKIMLVAGSQWKQQESKTKWREADMFTGKEKVRHSVLEKNH